MTGEHRSGTLELCIPADPALALTARMFAGAVSSHLPQTVSPDDLKLAFSELLARAIDGGAAEVVFRVDLDAGHVTVDATGTPSGGTNAAQEEEVFARSHRADLLAALFPGIQMDTRSVTLPLRSAE